MFARWDASPHHKDEKEISRGGAAPLSLLPILPAQSPGCRLGAWHCVAVPGQEVLNADGRASCEDKFQWVPMAPCQFPSTNCGHASCTSPRAVPSSSFLPPDAHVPEWQSPFGVQLTPCYWVLLPHCCQPLSCPFLGTDQNLCCAEDISDHAASGPRCSARCLSWHCIIIPFVAGCTCRR